MLPPSSYYNIYYHILQYNKTKYLTKKYRLYAACRHFSYLGTVKDPITNNKGFLREKTEGRDSPLVFVKYNNLLMMNSPKYDIIDL